MFHTIIIAGNVGRDPEMRYTPGGTPVTSFSVATSRNWTNAQGEATKETIWFRISCWNKLAETANSYVKKGSKVLVEGNLVADPATGGPRVFTRSDGTSGASFEVRAGTLRFLSSRAESEAAASAPASSGTAYQEYSEPVNEDDIPF